MNLATLWKRAPAATMPRAVKNDLSHPSHRYTGLAHVMPSLRPSNPTHAARIVLVEPNPISRGVLKTILECGGAQVFEAHDGVTAMELAAARGPDLLMQNVRLPDIHSNELVRLARTLQGPIPVPVLGYGHNALDVDKMRTRQAGFAGLLNKPFLPSHLLRSVRFYLWSKFMGQAKPEPALGPTAIDPRSMRKVQDERRILLVEDNPMQCTLIGNRLRETGYMVAEVNDGMQALDMLSRCPPDAVVTDTLMPGCDGYELCATMKQFPALADIPVILTPASAVEELDRQVALKLGAVAFALRSPHQGEILHALASLPSSASRRIGCA